MTELIHFIRWQISKKSFWLLFPALMVILCSGFVLSTNYTAYKTGDPFVIKATIHASYSISNLNDGDLSASTNGAVYTADPVNGTQLGINMSVPYTISQVGVYQMDDGGGTSPFNYYFYIDGVQVHSGYFDGVNLVFVNQSITPTDGSDMWMEFYFTAGTRTIYLTEIYFYGEPVGAGSPSLTLTSSMVDNDEIGLLDEPDSIYEVYFNGSVTSTTEIFNCSFYANSSLQSSLSDVNLSITQNFTLNFTGWDQGYNLNISCSNSNASDDTGLYNVYFDAVNPLVYASQITDRTDLLTKTYFRNFSNTRAFNWAAAAYDKNLYYVNFSFINSSGFALWNFYKENISGTTSTNSSTYPLNDQPAGVYELRLEAWDDHTKQSDIKPVIWTEEPGAIIIDGEIRLEGDIKTGTNPLGNPYTSFTLAEDGSKYKFKITFQDVAYEHTFTIKTSEKLVYRPGSGYMGHFVYMPLKRWIDLINPNIQDIDIDEISPNEYRITVHLFNAADELEFESLGDLNYATISYNVTLQESFIVYAYDALLNTSISSFTASLINSSFRETRSATAGWAAFNTTSGNFTLNISSSIYQSGNVSNLNITPLTNYTFYLTPENAIYMYFYDEVTGELINDRSVNFSIISDAYAANYTTTTGITLATAVAGEYDVIYEAENYTRRFSYFELSNDTSNNSLYLLLTSLDDDVILTVLDTVSNPVEDAYIYIYRYYLDSNDFINVVTRKTDFQGIAKVNLQLDSEYYKFEVYYDDTLKYATEKAYITEDAYDFTINVEGLTLEEFYSVLNTVGSLTFDNSTDTMTFTYLDSAGDVDQACLTVNIVSAGAENLFNETCLSAAGGSISIVLANTTGRKYAAVASITVDSQEYLFSTLTVQYSDKTDFGNVGLFVVAFLEIIMITIALKWPTTGLFLMGFPFIIGSGFNFINLNMEYSLGIEIACILLAALLRRKGQ